MSFFQMEHGTRDGGDHQKLWALEQFKHLKGPGDLERTPVSHLCDAAADSDSSPLPISAPYADCIIS